MTLRLYDTAKRTKLPLEPIEAGKVSIYVCGPTVYDYCHVGHARCYVSFDVIVRHLRRSGLAVTYARNVTDIDDKIINRARELGEASDVLSRRYANAFREDMALLGNLSPDIEPAVTDHIGPVIDLVQRLVQGEHAYVVDGDVYFAVDRFADYGALSARNIEDLRAGARVDVDERKRHPLDFALWKSAKAGEPAWDSPWGRGRPGWHIECSAMSQHYLGDQFDIHGGGMDLVFPHHENEMAQSRASSGPQSFARYWMHNGFVNVRSSASGDEKMSKSLGNFFTIREVCALHEPEALRLFLLGTHYRKPIQFDVEQEDDSVCFPSLEDAERRLAYSYRTLARLGAVLAAGKPAAKEGATVEGSDVFIGRFRAALDDDFNTAAALGHLAELLTLANKLLDQPKAQPKDVWRRSLARVAAGLEEVTAVLGLLGEDPQAFLLRRRDKLCKLRALDAAAVEQQLQQRSEARRAKDFGRADAIREELSAKGVELMDRPDGGTTWSVSED